MWDKWQAEACGAGAKLVNTEWPTSWSANPLGRCVFQKVARYGWTGDVKSASSFRCK